MSEWIKLDEKFPAKCETVILNFYGGRVRVGSSDTDRCGQRVWYSMKGEELCEKPTHWMPLPEPPKENGNMLFASMEEANDNA